jgi:Lsr2
MARNVSVVFTNDLDGSEGADAVRFGLDGATYEIDLGEGNRAKLEGDLAPFIAAARRQGRDSRRRGGGRAAPTSVDRAAVRAWAREAGLGISERGRIGAEILRQYEAAH